MNRLSARIIGGAGSLALGFTLVMAPAATLAQTEYPTCAGDPSPAEVEAAQGAFKAGKAAFDEADYDRSITYWLDAYRRDCRAHDLLQNLARAYELKGEKQEAVRALETYLERKPDAPQRDQFERRIEKLREQIAAEETPPPPAAPPAAAAAPPTATPPNPPTPPPPVERSRKPIAPILVTATGGAIAVVGGALWYLAHVDVADYEDLCGADRQGCPSEVKDDANTARSREIISGSVAIGGLAVGAAGLIWYVAAPERTVEKRAGRRLTPMVGPGFVGASVTGRF